MATVQEALLKVVQRISATTKDGQTIQDDSAATVINGAVTNGGLIKIQTATDHGLATNQKAFIKGVVGTTEANNTLANPAWPVTVDDATHVTLQGSVFTNAYVSAGTIVGALVGTVEPAGITRQRVLDIYNQTRFVLARILIKQYPQSMVSSLAPGIAKRKTDLTFSSGTAAKPSGLVTVVALESAAAVPISVIPISQRRILKDLDSAVNPLVMDYGQSFVAINGSTYVPNASTYVLDYIGLDVWTLSDVIFFSGTEAVETFSEDWFPILVEGCAAFASGQGVAGVENVLAPMVEQVIK